MSLCLMDAVRVTIGSTNPKSHSSRHYKGPTRSSLLPGFSLGAIEISDVRYLRLITLGRAPLLYRGACGSCIHNF